MKREKINILQLVDGFRLGGAETKLLELIKHLDKDKNKITVCSLTSAGSLQRDFESVGVKVKVFPRKHRFDVTLIPTLVRFLRKERINIVQTTLFYADILGVIAARIARVPAVISWETISHEHAFYAPRYRRMAYRLAMKFVDRIVAVSKGVKESLIRGGITASKIKVIYYGVDLMRFNNQDNGKCKAEIGLDGVFPVIGVVARLDKIKGHEYLLRGLTKIVERYPGTKCLFVGDGTYRKALEKLTQELGLNNHVLFLGFRNDITCLLNTLDLFVLPSVSEGLPNVVLEAMACSLPVVATSVGGIPEILVNKQNGILVPPRDPMAIATAILELLDNRERRVSIGLNARKFVERKFSLETQVNQFQKLYDYCLMDKSNELYYE